MIKMRLQTLLSIRLSYENYYTIGSGMSYEKKLNEKKIDGIGEKKRHTIGEIMINMIGEIRKSTTDK